MTRRFLIVSVALACLVGTTACSTFAVAAATVNGQKIAESEVETELDRVRNDPTFKDLLRRQADELRGTARRNILSGLIRQAVLAEEAQRRKIRVTRAQVDRLIAQEAERQGLTVDEFRKAQNLSEDGARTIGERIVRVFELRREVTTDIPVEPERIRAAYEAQKDVFLEVHLLRITVGSDTDARRVLERLNEGTRFSTMARRDSIDDLADDGGDMGYVPVARLAPEVQAAIQQADSGTVTDPIASGPTLEIYRVVDRRTRTLDDVADEIRAQLADQSREQAFQSWLDRRLRAARVVVNPKYGTFDDRSLQVVPGRRSLRP